MTDEEETKKKTTRTGKRIGMKNRCKVSIALNDSDRNVSRMWELLKKHYSRKKITAAELGRMIFLRGAISVLEEIELENNVRGKSHEDANQLKLF